MALLKQSLFRTLWGFFPFSPRYWPLLCMIHSVTEILLETHLLMIEKIPDWFNKLFACKEEIPDADILAPRLYPALILYPEDGLNVPSELVFRNDMIQINVRCVWGKAPVIVFLSSVVEYLFQECKMKGITDPPSILYMENSWRITFFWVWYMDENSSFTCGFLGTNIR